MDLNSVDENRVTTQKILSKITDELIFRHYIGDYSKCINSPLRKDNNPSFSVYYSTHHRKLMFKDHATGSFGDCFDLVRSMYNVTLYGACCRINEDFNLGFDKSDVDHHAIYVRPTTIRNNIEINKNLSIKIRPWKNCDTDYWTKNYGLEEKHLKYFNVVPVAIVFINDRIIWTHDYSNPIYAYVFYKDGVFTYKVYRPLSKEKQYKWISTTNRSVLQGWDQMPKTGSVLIITKSMKDAMIYALNGYASISCQNETSMIKDTVFEELKSRFKLIVINQDDDPAGRIGTEALCSRYELPHFYLDIQKEAKDISDFREKYGAEKTKQLIEHKLLNLWNKTTTTSSDEECPF